MFPVGIRCLHNGLAIAGGSEFMQSSCTCTEHVCTGCDGNELTLSGRSTSAAPRAPGYRVHVHVRMARARTQAKARPTSTSCTSHIDDPMHAKRVLVDGLAVVHRS